MVVDTDADFDWRPPLSARVIVAAAMRRGDRIGPNHVRLALDADDFIRAGVGSGPFGGSLGKKKGRGMSQAID
jgi:hypothetical protein